VLKLQLSSGNSIHFTLICKHAVDKMQWGTRGYYVALSLNNGLLKKLLESVLIANICSWQLRLYEFSYYDQIIPSAL